MSKDYIPRGLRELVARTACRRCGYCLTQEAVVGTPMVIDHIVPESLGGPTEELNLWLACPLCNAHKGDRITALDANTGEIVRLFNPRQQAPPARASPACDPVKLVERSRATATQRQRGTHVAQRGPPATTRAGSSVRSRVQ